MLSLFVSYSIWNSFTETKHNNVQQFPTQIRRDRQRVPGRLRSRRCVSTCQILRVQQLRSSLSPKITIAGSSLPRITSFFTRQESES